MDSCNTPCIMQVTVAVSVITINDSEMSTILLMYTKVNEYVAESQQYYGIEYVHSSVCKVVDLLKMRNRKRDCSDK
jgi:transposase